MSSVAEKPSQVLKEALAQFEGGAKWINSGSGGGYQMCAVQAVGRVAVDFDQRYDARKYLRLATGHTAITHWNDNAADFSVIEQGFRAAIALAEMEGR